LNVLLPLRLRAFGFWSQDQTKQVELTNSKQIKLVFAGFEQEQGHAMSGLTGCCIIDPRRAFYAWQQQSWSRLAQAVGANNFRAWARNRIRNNRPYSTTVCGELKRTI